MRTVLGFGNWPTRKAALCPKCDNLDLFVKDGSKWVECGSCAAIMSPDEYDDWARSLVTQADG